MLWAHEISVLLLAALYAVVDYNTLVREHISIRHNARARKIRRFSSLLWIIGLIGRIGLI